MFSYFVIFNCAFKMIEFKLLIYQYLFLVNDKIRAYVMLVFKNNFSLFYHINQNFNVLLYKSFNKKLCCTGVHSHTHTHTQRHIDTLTYTKKTNAPFMIWHFGHMEQFALICWLGGHAVQKSLFIEWHPFSLAGLCSPSRAQATNSVYLRPH